MNFDRDFLMVIDRQIDNIQIDIWVDDIQIYRQIMMANSI